MKALLLSRVCQSPSALFNRAKSRAKGDKTSASPAQGAGMGAARSPSIVLACGTHLQPSVGREAAGGAGGPRECRTGAGGAGALQSLCGEHSAYELRPARGNRDGLRSTRLHGMAEMVGNWWQQGCPEVGIGSVWRQVGMETPVPSSPQPWGGPVASRLQVRGSEPSLV